MLVLLMLMRENTNVDKASDFLKKAAYVAILRVCPYATVDLECFGFWPGLHKSNKVARIVALPFQRYIPAAES